MRADRSGHCPHPWGCSLTFLNHSEGSPGHVRSLLYVPSSWETQGTLSASLRPRVHTAVATPGSATLTGSSRPGQVWPPTDQGGPCEWSWGLEGTSSSKKRCGHRLRAHAVPPGKDLRLLRSRGCGVAGKPMNVPVRGNSTWSRHSPHRSWQPDPEVG